MEKKYLELKKQVEWAINHYGIVKTDGIIQHLRNTLLAMEKRTTLRNRRDVSQQAKERK